MAKNDRDKIWRHSDPKDGHAVNSIIHNMKVSGYRYSMSIYDEHNICLDFRSGLVSVIKKVRKLNGARAPEANSCRHRLTK